MLKKYLQTYLKRILSCMLIMTLLAGLFVSAGILYPTTKDVSHAATFKASGSGVDAPPFNDDNFPYDINNYYGYYIGKEGNDFGLIQKKDTYMYFMDKDAMIGNKSFATSFTSPDGAKIGNHVQSTDGQHLLDYVNGLTSSFFNDADKEAMIPKDISVNTVIDYNLLPDDSGEKGKGSIKNAYMWPPSSEEVFDNPGTANSSLKITGNFWNKLCSGEYSYIQQLWTRTYAGKSSSENTYNGAYIYIGEYNGDRGIFEFRDFVENSKYVLPAFLLDLKKVLLTKKSSSGSSAETMSSAPNVQSVDRKFLINAGTNKGNFNVADIKGKTLTNIFAGTTYSFDYTGASTSHLNGGTNYVSAIIYDSEGKACYYGNLGTINSSSGNASIKIPSDLSGGTYTLALFEEEKCAKEKTDYASAPVYAKFTVQTVNYETDAKISSTQSTCVNVGDKILSDKFSADVSYLDCSTSKEDVYVLSSADFDKVSDKRSISSKSVTVPNGSSSFKVTAVFVPEHTNEKSFWSKEFTYKLNYEKATSFQTLHSTSFSLNDIITSDDFSGKIEWFDGKKTDVQNKDIYIVPTQIWGDGLTKEQVEALSNYQGGKSIKIDSSELNGAESYGVTAVYYPEISGADEYHAQDFVFNSSSLYSTAFIASYNGEPAEFGALLSDKDFSGSYTLSDGDKTEVEASKKYILATDVWNSLSDSIKGNESRLQSVKGVNSVVIPNETDLSGVEDYGITVVYYDYSENHASGGGIDAGNCNYYFQDVKVPLVSATKKEYESYSASGITWYYQTDEHDNAVNVYTLSEDIGQIVDKDGAFNIPSKINNHVVKSIGTGKKDKPFVPANVNSFTKINFPETLTDINSYAFYSNTAFARLSIPATVGSVGDFAFYDCDNISYAEIDSTLIGTAAFGNCSGLKEVSVTGSSFIGKVAFADCSNLMKLTVSGDTGIGKSAFVNDTNINAVNLKKLKNARIEGYAFKGCTSIKEIYIPSNNIVDAYAFDECTGIKYLELDMETIENNSFVGCCNIRYLIFGENVSLVKYNWGGYSAENYDNAGSYTEVIDTTIYVKNKDTKFEAFRSGEEVYSSFMGHYVPSGPHKYSRNISVFYPEEESEEHSIEDCLIQATASYLEKAKDEIVEGSYSNTDYYTANGLLDVTFHTDSSVGDKTINLPAKRDGISAYYNGKVYDNEKANKAQIIVNPVYSDATPAKESLKDFFFYAESEVDTAIRNWLKSSDYSYKNVIPDKLEKDKEYTYSQYLGFVETNIITGDDLEKERLAMIQSVFDDRSLFTAATADVIDNPTIYGVDNNQNFAIQHLKVIYYPDKDSGKDKDYHSGEPLYYVTSIDLKVVKYTDEMYFFDQGYTYETVVKEIKKLQEDIAGLTEDVARLEQSKDSLEGEKDHYAEELLQCKEQLSEYTAMYERLIEQLKNYIGSIEAEGDGYLGNKTITDENGKETVIRVVWINGKEYVYKDTDEDGIYEGSGDLNGDGETDRFKFYVAADGVHVIEINGEEVDEIYSDTIGALERKLTAMLSEVRAQLAGISEKLTALKAALDISGENFDHLTNEEKMDVILSKVNSLIKEKSDLDELVRKRDETIRYYESTIEEVYKQLVSGSLDKPDVSTLQQKLEEILAKAKKISDEKADLEKEISGLETKMKSLKEEITKKDGIIEEFNEKIRQFEKEAATAKDTLAKQAATIQELEKNAGSYVLTVKDAAELFGTSQNASASEVKASINAFIVAKVENENTIRLIQKKLNTDADGNALVALINVPGNGGDELQSKYDAMSTELEKLKKSYEVLNGKNIQLGKDVQTLTASNKKSSDSVTTLTGNKKELEKRIASLQSENKSLEKKVAELSKTKKSSVTSTPRPTQAHITTVGHSQIPTSGWSGGKAGSTRYNTATPKPTSKADTVKEKSSAKNPESYHKPVSSAGKVVSTTFPEINDGQELKSTKMTVMEEDATYVGTITSNGKKDTETTVSEKKRANSILAYYANHPEELDKFMSGSMSGNVETDKNLVLNTIGSINVAPSNIQSAAMKNNEKLELKLYSDEFESGKTYLIIHESKDREGIYDVALATPENGSLSVHLLDLSPVSVAEINTSDIISKTDATKVFASTGVSEQEDEDSSNGKLQLVFIVIGAIAVLGVVGFLFITKRQKGEKYNRR